ncbi:MAG: permease [Trueperaceae bacterium]
MTDTLRTFVVLALEFTALFFAVSWVVYLIVDSIPRQRLRSLLAGNPVRGTFMALILGAVTPFCSCSTVPVVAGMAGAGVAVPTLTAFLVMSPLVNPATIALLATLVSPWYAGAFVLASAVLAATLGVVMGLLRIRLPAPAQFGAVGPAGPVAPWRTRLIASAARAWRDLRKLAPLLALVAAIGALLHDRVSPAFVQTALAAAGPWAVPVAVLLGAPMYASTAVLLPVGATLAASGLPLGVVTGFLIGATGLSVPEGVMLQRLLGGRYLAVLAFGFVVAATLLAFLVQALAS